VLRAGHEGRNVFVIVPCEGRRALQHRGGIGRHRPGPLNFSLPSRGKAVYRGHWRRSKDFSGHIRSVPYGAVAALCCCTTLPSLTLNTATALTNGYDGHALHAAGSSLVTGSKRRPAVSVLELEESEARPRTRVRRAEESGHNGKCGPFRWRATSRSPAEGRFTQIVVWRIAG
jgi:hypothetical protein